MNNIEKTTLGKGSKRLLKDLQALGRSDISSLIEEVKAGHFDDYHKNSYAFPKMELVDRLRTVNLQDIAEDVQSGKYDD